MELMAKVHDRSDMEWPTMCAVQEKKVASLLKPPTPQLAPRTDGLADRALISCTPGSASSVAPGVLDIFGDAPLEFNMSREWQETVCPGTPMQRDIVRTSFVDRRAIVGRFAEQTRCLPLDKKLPSVVPLSSHTRRRTNMTATSQVQRTEKSLGELSLRGIRVRVPPSPAALTSQVERSSEQELPSLRTVSFPMWNGSTVFGPGRSAVKRADHPHPPDANRVLPVHAGTAEALEGMLTEYATELHQCLLGEFATQRRKRLITGKDYHKGSIGEELRKEDSPFVMQATGPTGNGML